MRKKYFLYFNSLFCFASQTCRPRVSLPVVPLSLMIPGVRQLSAFKDD